ncbi:hypothetical protein ANCCAN_02618 [Ancylostoma caninum]|uniref:Tc1-like transposase DDE domain-containing protein n=1 Tax=Ancylostoma caninum TaxID=29170 RepID=A0A368H7I1_ANCCA|nr:hypothetical protein ANCCAN_02618 [Ancylostoma caninum]
MRKMAKDIGVSASSMRRVVKQKLQLRSYRARTAPLLTEEMRQIRLKRCKKLLKRFAEGSHRNIVFSDEKIFTVAPVVNSQNNRALAKDIEQALSRGKIVGKTAHPTSVMVWGNITSDGKTLLVFVDIGVKINKDIYLKSILDDVLKPWSTSHFGSRQWCFQQDSAPAHKANVVQEWCRREIPDFIACGDWPSNSPNLNPLDFSVWSVVESKACSIRHQNLEELKAALTKAWQEMGSDYLRMTCDAFMKRLRRCVREKGGHFE